MLLGQAYCYYKENKKILSDCLTGAKEDKLFFAGADYTNNT